MCSRIWENLQPQAIAKAALPGCAPAPSGPTCWAMNIKTIFWAAFDRCLGPGMDETGAALTELLSADQDLGLPCIRCFQLFSYLRLNRRAKGDSFGDQVVNPQFVRQIQFACGTPIAGINLLFPPHNPLEDHPVTIPRRNSCDSSGISALKVLVCQLS